MTSVGNSVSTTNYPTFDQAGRVLSSTQATGGVDYLFSYGYNLAGSLQTMTLPSSRQISYSFDDHGRVSAISGTYQGVPSQYTSTDPTKAIQYAPHGGLASVTLGNGIVESSTYNNRLQLQQIRAGTLLTLDYTYGASGSNNGNVQTQTITRDSTPALKPWYQYDGVNRLKLATEKPANTAQLVCPDAGAAWCQQYGYGDGFGNRYVSAHSGAPAEPTLETATGTSWYQWNNRLTSWGYDPAGNVLQVAAMTRNFQYDAESRQTSATVPASTSTYGYDGQGRRVTQVVTKGSGASATSMSVVYVYDAQGQLAVEIGTGAAGPAPCMPSPCYLTADALGSTRLVTDKSGLTVSAHDYMPFGEELTGVGARGAAFGLVEVSEKFTGKERDVETGLDYFGARYFSGAQGRFTSPDQPLVAHNRSDPQSWNLYTYGLNNPLRFTDPTGQFAVDGQDKDCGTNLKDCAPPMERLGGDPKQDHYIDDKTTMSGLPERKRGQTQDRVVGAVKGASEDVLDILSLMGAPDSNLDQIRNFFGLQSQSENERFGKDVLEIAALFSGGGKTGRKINEARYLANKGAVELLERVLERLETSRNKNPAIKEAIKIVEGRLSQARDALKKSEPHGVTGQGFRR